jgi:hypothetical protein
MAPGQRPGTKLAESFCNRNTLQGLASMTIRINHHLSLQIQRGTTLFSYFSGKTNRVELRSLTLCCVEFRLYRQRIWILE